MISSSWIVGQALGIAPEGMTAKTACRCAYCGIGIEAGDICSPFSPSDGFMDTHSLAGKGSAYVCGYCAQLVTDAGLKKTGYGVFSAEGVRDFRDTENVAKSLINPPDSPFCMLYSGSKNPVHMAWRAPVNFSKDMYYVRVAQRDLKIRRKTLIKAVDVCQEVASVFGITPGPKRAANPFAELTYKLNSPEHGKLRFTPYSQPTKNEPRMADKLQIVKKEIQFLQQLTLGETWGLGFLLSNSHLLSQS